jgi:hypothetical protein
MATDLLCYKHKRSLSQKLYFILFCSLSDGLQIWRVAVNILNKQSRTDDGGGPPASGLGGG